MVMTVNSEENTKILIIGNGFDLAHLLPTGYGDFIAFVMTLETLGDNLSNLTFCDVFKSKQLKERWVDDVRKNYNVDKMRFDLTEMKAMLDNAWLNYFKPIHDIQTWIDFEKEIGEALNIVSTFCNLAQKISSSDAAVKTIVSFAGQPNTLPQKKVDKLFHLNLLKRNASFNNAEFAEIQKFGSLMSCVYDVNSRCYTNNTGSGLVDVNATAISEYLLNQLDSFIDLFALYLKVVLKPFYDNIGSDKINNLMQFHDVFSFNYTNTISNFYTNSQAGEFYHLHGNVMNGSKNIVLGVHDVETDVLGLSALGFTKYYQTLFKGTKSAFLEGAYSISQKARGLDYYIWGHSLDKSDEKYIKQLFQELSSNINGAYNKPSTITIYYHSQSAKAGYLKNLLHIIGKEKIEKYVYQGLLTFKPSPPIWNEKSNKTHLTL